jgi:hypothetical protein
LAVHPPPLASEYSASYGEMSRRSGEAAKADIWIRQNRRPGLRTQRLNEMTDLVVDLPLIGNGLRDALAQ